MTIGAVMIVSLLCIRSGPADTNISDPVVPVNRSESAGGQTERNIGEVLEAATTTRITVSEMDVTDRPAEQIQDEPFTTFQSLQTPKVTGRTEQPMNDSTAELLRVQSSRVLNNDVVRGNSFEVVLLMHNTSTVAVQPLVFASDNLRANNKNMYPTNRHFSDNNTNTAGDDDEKYESVEIIHTETHPANNRQVKHNKMVHDDQSMARTNNIVGKKGGSTGHLKLYDPPNKMHDYSYTEDDISADGIGGNTIGRPENTHPATWAGGIGVWDQPSRENYGYDYLSKPSRVTKDRRRPMQQKENKIDWHTISTLAFIKLGMVKLQTIGFLNILFLIWFKLKLYMTAVFVKFLLIMKLMKLSKILILPLLILQLLPTLIQFLSMRTSNNMMMNMSGTTQQNSGLTSSQSGNVLPGTSLTGGTNGITGTTGTGLPSGATGTGLPSGTTGTGLTGGTTETTGIGRPGGITGMGLPSDATGTGRPGGISGMGQTRRKRLSAFKFDDLNLTSQQHNVSWIRKNT